MDAGHKQIESELGAKASQALCDAEVISFLDARVKELETQLSKEKNEVTTTKRNLSKANQERTSQIRVLEDMLSFERQSKTSFVEDEKRTKSILIREVKTQRAQNFVLSEEVGTLRREVEILRAKILSSASSRRSTVTGPY